VKKNQFFFEHGLHLATFCAVLGLLFFVPASMTQILGLRVFFGVLIAMLLAVGVVFLYLSHRAKKERVHYFLYDHRRKLNLPMSALSPDLIREKMDAYLSRYTDSVESLWQEIPKKLRLQLEADTQFLPLISYRMLLDLSEKDAPVISDIFENADSRAVGYICRAIRDAGDADLADHVFHLKKSVEENGSRIPVFFHKNRPRFEERMMRFVERHMNDFYVDREKI
jgi:hypothetical protein